MRRTRKVKRYKKKRTRKNKRLAGTLQMLASEQLLKSGVTPLQLKVNEYPDSIVQYFTKVAENRAQKTIKNAVRVQHIKRYRELELYFKNYNKLTDGDYDIYDKKLANMCKLAAKILNKNDIKNKFWQNVLGKRKNRYLNKKN